MYFSNIRYFYSWCKPFKQQLQICSFQLPALAIIISLSVFPVAQWRNGSCNFEKSFSYIKNTFAVFPEICKIMIKYFLRLQCTAPNRKQLKNIKVLQSTRNCFSRKQTFMFYTQFCHIAYFNQGRILDSARWFSEYHKMKFI